MWNKAIEGTDQCCFAAAASSGQEDKFSGLYGHINTTESKILTFFISKAKILK